MRIWSRTPDAASARRAWTMMERWSQLHVVNIAAISYTGGRITLNGVNQASAPRDAVMRTASPFKLLEGSRRRS